MKPAYYRILLTSIFLFCQVLVFSQAIDNVSLNPINPTPEDSVSVITNVWLPSGGCWLDNHFSLVNQDTLIDIFGTFDSGMLTVICSCSDTFNLGRLEPGSYHIRYIMRYLNHPAFADTANLSFTVGSTAGINPVLKEEKKFSVWQGNNADQVQLAYSLKAGEFPQSLSVYSIDGRLIQYFATLEMGSSPILLPSPGHSGLYLYTLKTSSNQSYTYKFLLP